MKPVNKIKGNISVENLMLMLNSALERQGEMWKPVYYSSSSSTENVIGSDERNSVVEWFLELNGSFKFNPETIVLCIAIFDYFNSVMKVKPKYCKCIAVSCLFIAIKTMEEDEVIPTTAELLESVQCSYNVSDILRMEKIILVKLNWNSKLVSSLEFVHIMHGLLLLNHPKLACSPGRQLTNLTRKLNRCLSSHSLLAFKPSTLALALLSLELQTCTRDWLALTIMMQHFIKLANDDLIHCREAISDTLSQRDPSQDAFTKIIPVKRSTSSPAIKSSKRKVEQIEVDDIYDSIKRLYNEDVQTGLCATQAEQLQTVSNPALLPISAT